MSLLTLISPPMQNAIYNIYALRELQANVKHPTSFVRQTPERTLEQFFLSPDRKYHLHCTDGWLMFDQRITEAGRGGLEGYSPQDDLLAEKEAAWRESVQDLLLPPCIQVGVYPKDINPPTEYAFTLCSREELVALSPSTLFRLIDGYLATIGEFQHHIRFVSNDPERHVLAVQGDRLIPVDETLPDDEGLDTYAIAFGKVYGEALAAG